MCVAYAGLCEYLGHTPNLENARLGLCTPQVGWLLHEIHQSPSGRTLLAMMNGHLLLLPNPLCSAGLGGESGPGERRALFRQSQETDHHMEW